MSDQVNLTPTHHAMLFAWLARQVIDQAGGERGEAIVLEGVTRYGHERGSRMAQRATADGHPLDYFHYLAYGEWRAEPGTSRSVVLRARPDLHQRVSRCPWSDAWAESDLMRYGGLYCRRIDVSLVEGFNPELALLVDETMSNGGEACDFRFVGANMDTLKLEQVGALRAELGERTIMPWRYHCAHLLCTVGHKIVEHLGAMGELLVGDAVAEFQAAYGDEATRAVTSLVRLDFGRAMAPDELP